MHAKGQLVRGTFVLTSAARYLSKASIFTTPSTPLICRYSTDTGYKDFPDNGDNASRGFAVRFLLSDDGHKHFDIITNNAFGFIVGTGEAFLEQFKYLKEGKMDEFLAKNTHAKHFQENCGPVHAYSFATEQWYATHAYKFINAEGKERFFRWRFVPWQGVMKYSQADAGKRGKNYQFDDLRWRMKNNRPIRYRLLAQLAETNEFVEMGEVTIDGLWEEEGEKEWLGRKQKRIIYDPMPRYIEGIANGDDPLVEVRTSVYLQSGLGRREADGVQTKPEDYKTCPFWSL